MCMSCSQVFGCIPCTELHAETAWCLRGCQRICSKACCLDCPQCTLHVPLQIKAEWDSIHKAQGGLTACLESSCNTLPVALSDCWRWQPLHTCWWLCVNEWSVLQWLQQSTALPVPAVGHDSFAESTFCSKEVAKGLNDIITYGGADQLLPCCLYGSRTAC